MNLVPLRDRPARHPGNTGERDRIRPGPSNPRMRVTRGLLVAGLVLAGPAVLRLSAADRKSSEQVAAEIQRIEQTGKKPAPSDPAMAGVASAAQSALKSAGEALQSERLYLALERLAQAVDLFGGLDELAATAAAPPSDIAAFEVEWGKTSRELAALSRQVQSRDPGRLPAAVRALSEAALGRSVPLLDGGRGFAVATGPKDGLFYLGEARGEAKFADFCGSLAASRKRSGWGARSLLPELLALQAKADEAFQPPRSIEQHSRFIALNSTIKLARELDSTKSYYGALYQYLESLRHYALLDAPPVDAARQAELKSAVAAELARFAASSRDDSIPQLFLERAASQTVHPDGSAPSADEWRSAQAILTQVLPAYAAAMKAPAPLRQTGGKTVDVTLVRWPYT